MTINCEEGMHVAEWPKHRVETWYQYCEPALSVNIYSLSKGTPVLAHWIKGRDSVIDCIDH